VNAKQRAFHILAVCVVADSGDGVFGHDDLSTVPRYLLQIFIDIGYTDGIDSARNDTFGAGNAAIDTGLNLVASIY
jgi:hypothetical protein